MEDIAEIKNIDVLGIMRLLPHRYPFILVDRITSLVPRKSVTGIKNVTMNEQFFQGHFPDRPVMPGVLILEGMAQAGGCMAYHSFPEMIDNKLLYFASIEDWHPSRSFLRRLVQFPQVSRGYQGLRLFLHNPRE